MSQLAHFFNSDIEGAGNWQSDEFGAMWQHQMAALLFSDFTLVPSMQEETARLVRLAHQHQLVTFMDLLQHPQPPTELLVAVKNFAKSHLEHPQGLLPGVIAATLYYLAIAAALVKLSQRITSLELPTFRQGLEWCLSLPWLDQTSRELCQQATVIAFQES